MSKTKKIVKGYAMIDRLTGLMVHCVEASKIKNPRSLSIIYGPEYYIAPCEIVYKLPFS